jgi:choline dehydrogenase-like flavoprotein
MAPAAFVDDRENPYVTEPDAPFDWFRARQIGGRMTIPGHGRQYYRLGERDLRPGDGLSPSWPVDAADLAAWYDLVEQRLGLTSGLEDCDWVPAGSVAAACAPTAAEADAIRTLKAKWPSVDPLLGRAAPPMASVEMAAATGRLVCRQGAIVARIDAAGGDLNQVHWKDRASGGDLQAAAPIVFLCASSLESTRILLQSRAADGQPIGARSGVLGQGLMDHVVVSAEGVGAGLAGEPEPMTAGRCLYLPRFDLRERPDTNRRGYGVQIYRWSLGRGRSHFAGVAFAEMTPRPENRVALDPARKDAWDLPILRVSCRHSPSELDLAADQRQALEDLADALRVRLHRLSDGPAPPGTAIHECGTARMGLSPEDSVLDPDNQCWDAPGLFVTDGAAFPSQGAQNPTLTILALTARACVKALGTRRRPDHALSRTPLPASA